mgnify:CR=1 FL=1
MSEVDLGVAALAGVGAASLAAAIIALLAIRRFSDQVALGRAKASAQAHLLEFRLFMDEPAVLLRSQRALVMDNLRVMRILLRPTLVMTVPMALGLWQLDGLYGRAPLRVGQPAVVWTHTTAKTVAVPAAIAVETKPVHIQFGGETCWRVRAASATSGTLRIGNAATRIVAGEGVSYLPQPLFGQSRIEIGYPRATILGWHWLIWFLILSTVWGFALRRPMGVRF